MSRRKHGESRQQVRGGDDDAQKRLVALLALPGAFGRQDGALLRVFAPRKGVTLQVGTAPCAVVSALESAGAVERRAADGCHVLSQAGYARARRVADAEDNAFAAQHRDIARAPSPEADQSEVALNLAESPLLWLHRRGKGLIGDAEFAAGERLRSDMTIARALPRLTANLEREVSSGVAIALQPSEARMAASQRVQAALRAVGPEFSGILVDVCGFLAGLEQIERDRHWPARSAKLVLALALAALARHYGLSNMAIGHRGRRRTHAWGDVDFRPEFSLPDAAAPQPAPRP